MPRGLRSRAAATRARSTTTGFPKSLCTSVNEVICHGIPDNRTLRDGDIVNLDITVFREGVHGDTNATFLVGDVDPSPGGWSGDPRVPAPGIDAVRPGRPISDIGRAIEEHAEGRRASAWCGRSSATASASSSTPTCRSPTTTTRGPRTVMEPGMVFTIEPMITLGDWRHRLWDDGWTAVTADGQPLRPVRAHAARHRRRLRRPDAPRGRPLRRRSARRPLISW